MPIWICNIISCNFINEKTCPNHIFYVYVLILDVWLTQVRISGLNSSQGVTSPPVYRYPSFSTLKTISPRFEGLPPINWPFIWLILFVRMYLTLLECRCLIFLDNSCKIRFYMIFPLRYSTGFISLSFHCCAYTFAFVCRLFHGLCKIKFNWDR